VKKLVGMGRQLRLHVGDWRVRFVYEKPDIIRVLHIRNRRDAYRD
jgi:mRNA-degrading endonuclease RelE of RelBE toxin-antitoxin system